MPIDLALLKYGYSNFSLTILEFYNINSLVDTEKYYFEVFSPEYNILKEPRGNYLGSGLIRSEASRENIRIAASKRSKSLKYLENQSKAQSNSLGVEVTNLKTNTITNYHAVRATARALGIDKIYIENYFFLKQARSEKNLF
jgi:Fic family protein